MDQNILYIANKNPDFRKAYIHGVKHGLIQRFPEGFLNDMRSIYLAVRECTLYDFFINGCNVGRCREAANYLTRMFPQWAVYIGLLPAIKGTLRSPGGEHAWLVSNGKIYDTSLLLIVDEEYAANLGYQVVELLNSRPSPSRKRNLKTML